MAEATDNPNAAPAAGEPAGSAPPGPVIHVSPSPHVYDTRLTTRTMMLDVLIGLAPVVAMSLVVFRAYAAMHIGLCVGTCLLAELVFTAMRRRPVTIGDGSAAVTGLILALSLPAAAPWYVSVIGAVMAIGIGKVLFGGLGQNLFNPAMVGRAFVMLAFAGALGASGYVVAKDAVWMGADAVTQATPLTLLKQGRFEEFARVWGLGKLIVGNTNGSLGETSSWACLAGGLYLVIRRTASWQIPAGVLLAVAVIGGIIQVVTGTPFTVAHHLLGGALLFGAFFIATDLVTSPLTPKGKFLFGLGVGALVMLIRRLSNYPEGVMFAVLVMNALVPLINRWTIPTPVGGPVPQKE
jgi:electron transport complex protein RnfD